MSTTKPALLRGSEHFSTVESETKRGPESLAGNRPSDRLSLPRTKGADGIMVPHPPDATPDPAPYTCPGIGTPQPPDAPFPGYVACYRAGHQCPPKDAIREESAEGVKTTLRCPCCGDFGGSMFIPREWMDD